MQKRSTERYKSNSAFTCVLARERVRTKQRYSSGDGRKPFDLSWSNSGQSPKQQEYTSTGRAKRRSFTRGRGKGAENAPKEET